MKLIEAKKLGKKSGEGFYVWRDGKAEKAPVSLDRAALEKLGRELVEPLIRECEKVRDEGVVASADLVDAGVIFGTGFAPFRGGPLHFASREVVRLTPATDTTAPAKAAA
jgi:3-hydroxyacyl-CoA dehydrogenase/enoyl-CoA hydratase/3-hydroxybutyryl-CoA epimerase